jgi:Ca-activated chloride channel family protein
MLSRNRFIRLSLFCLLASIVVAGWAFSDDAARPGAGPGAVLVELPAGTTLTAADFQLLAAGTRRDILQVERPQPEAPWQLVIYLDTPLASPRTGQRAAVVLGSLASELTDLGSVEIVQADPLPERLLAATREPAALDATLSQAALTADTAHAVKALRERYFQRLWYQMQLPGGTPTREIAALLREAVAEEARLIQRQADALLSWLAALPGTAEEDQAAAPPRRALLLVSDGFDDDPWSFYRGQIPDPSLAAALDRERPPQPFAAIADELARNIAGLGWVVIPLPLEGALAELPRGGTANDRFRDLAADRPVDSQPTWTTTTLESLKRRIQGQQPEVAPQGPVIVGGRGPLEALATASGGTLATGEGTLRGVLEGLQRRVAIRFADPPPGLYEVAVATPGWGGEIRAPRWLGRELPDAVAAARVRRLLAGEPATGELEVLAAVEGEPGGPGTVEARVDLIPLSQADEPGRVAPLRITVGIGDANGDVASLVHAREGVDALGYAGNWRFRREVPLPAGVERVAVVVEDLETGAWGGALAALVAPSADTPEEDTLFSALAEAEFLPRTRAIRLLPPPGEVLRGRIRFDAVVQEQGVARVVFLLDGEKVEEKDRPPYSARIAVGRFPQPRTITVEAYDAAGQVLGRDSLAINSGGPGFRVRILHPAAGKVGTGPVDVDVDVTLPPDRRFDRLELSWNDRRVATLYSPPFRQRVVVPANDPVGFIRAVAYLEDGRSAEDVVFLNEPDFSERVQIRLVELYTVVTNSDGQPIQGLTAEDFVVRENGVEQEIETFNDAGDLPLTLGLTIDSSASMFVKLPIVQEAAGDFVRGFLSGRDRAFLVDFDTEPRLVREMTSELRRVIDGIYSLRADGETHLWESVVFSLLELQGMTGKKAVVVFSDGAQEKEELEFNTCLELARRVGIPIYLVVLHPGLARGDDLTSSMKGFTRKLERLTDTVGGRVYYIPNTDNLDRIYAEINEELRSQYLLTYYPSEPVEKDDEWRDVDVDVKERGLKARTISGYFPRW